MESVQGHKQTVTVDIPSIDYNCTPIQSIPRTRVPLPVLHPVCVY